MPAAFYILFGAVFTVAVSYAAGVWLLVKLRLQFHRLEHGLIAFVSGAACLHLLVFTLCAAQLAYKGVFLAMGAMILVGAWMAGSFHQLGRPKLPPLTRAQLMLFGTIFAAYAFLYVVNAMMPEMSPDGSGYHLGLVARYLRDRGFSRITTNMYANLTQGIEMLFVFAFVFGRHSAASLVHCALTLALPILMLVHARRMGSPWAGIVGAVLVLCAPVTGVAGTSGYNDLGVACSVFTTFHVLSVWNERRERSLLVIAGLLAGFCFAVKYTAALMIPFGAVWVLAASVRGRQPWLRNIAVFGLFAALLVIPWTAKNWILVGNPLSPFANRFFPNPNVRISFEEDYIRHMRNYGNIESWREIPPDLLLKGEKLAGLLGPVFLFLPLCLFAVRKPEGRLLLVAGAVFFLPYLNNVGTRFLLPSLPFFTLALGLAIVNTRGLAPMIVIAHAFLSWPHVLRQYCGEYAWRLEGMQVAAALRVRDEERFLSSHFGGYVAARMVEEMVPEGEKVFTYSGIPEAYTKREILVAYEAGFNNTLGEMIFTALFQNDYAPAKLVRFRFDAQPLRRVRVSQVESAPNGWSIAEFRVYHDGSEIERRPEWRLRAWPNPWEVQLAFDGSPVTRWQSWEDRKPAMYVEADFGIEREASTVLLEVARSQYAKLELYGQRDRGPWIKLTDAPEESEVPVMEGLRRAAMDEFLARGVRYLAAVDSDPPAEDWRKNAPLWGITLLGERGGFRLYRIEAAK